MGIIRAIKQTVGGTLADQWLEVIEPENMGGQTVLTAGVRTGKGANRKGGKDTISNGSVIHVYEGQFMMLLDGGRIVDYSAEPGYFTVDNSSMPSMFSGSLDDVVKNSFDRFRFGGATPTSQKVLYLNLQEIKGIRFGTRNPISYFDNFYNAELFLRAHGTYSIRITDPIKFYVEAIPKNKDQVEITDINEQYLYEFLDALQSSINQMSADGMRISYVPSKSRELSKYMADTLDEDWRQTRGMEIQAVAIASLSYDEKSQELLNLRNQGAMLQDPSIREGYMQGAFARGMEAAGLKVVSGMARGSDSAAHWGALQEGGRTFAVLGCGVDICYPRENIDLYTEISRNGGIISELPPGTRPEGYQFPRRNRIIAALARGIVVTEAKQKSGTLITVEHGLNLGKEIFAVPGRIDDALSEGCNQLIKAGAKLVMQPSDILDEFGILAREYKKNNITLDNSEKVVYASICLVPRSADEIALLTGMEVQNVIHNLISMELKGIIHSVGKNQYVLNI